MHAPTALLISLLLFVSSWPARAEQVEWNEMLSRIRTSSISGLIYPADGKLAIALSDQLHWGDPKSAYDSAHWLPILNEQVLSQHGGKALQDKGGSVLLADQDAVRVYGLMTHPVKKGEYTGFEFLRQATSGLFTVAEVGMGAQLMTKTLHLKEDVPAQKLGALMFFLCGQLGGNYWSLTPAVVTAKVGAVLPDAPQILCPMVSTVVPGPPALGNKEKAQKQD